LRPATLARIHFHRERHQSEDQHFAGSEVCPGILRSLVEGENAFDRLLEKPADLEREGQARIILFSLDGVDSLTRNRQSRGQLSLRPSLLRAQFAKPVFHRYRRLVKACPIIQKVNAETKVPANSKP